MAYAANHLKHFDILITRLNIFIRKEIMELRNLARAVLLVTFIVQGVGSAGAQSDTPNSALLSDLQKNNFVAVPGPNTPPKSPTKWINENGAPHNVAIILLSYPGNPYPLGTSSSYAALRQKIAGQVFTNSNSINEYWQYTSYGAFSITGTVFGPVEVPYPPSPCDRDAWAASAQEMLTQDSGQTFPPGVQFDINDYQLVAYSNDKEPGTCKSQGKPGYDPPSAFMDNFSLRATSHELGHALGLDHSSGFQCFDLSGEPVPLGEICELVLKGDFYDTMGFAGEMTYTQQKRGQLGWLAGEFTTKTVVANGTFTEFEIYPIESGEDKLKVLRIPRVLGPYGIEEFYYVEFRQPVGFDIPLTTYKGVPTNATEYMPKGTMIRLARGYNRHGRSHLVDAKPLLLMGGVPALVEDFINAPFVPTGPEAPVSFIDPITGTVITTKSITKVPENFNNSFATVSVFPGTVLECSYGAPTVSLTPASGYVQVGVPPEDGQQGEESPLLKELNFSVDIKNWDSVNCPAVTIFANFSGAPSSWGFEALAQLSMEAPLAGRETITISRTINLSGAAPGLTELTLNVVNGYTGQSAPPITLMVDIL